MQTARWTFNTCSLLSATWHSELLIQSLLHSLFLSFSLDMSTGYTYRYIHTIIKLPIIIDVGLVQCTYPLIIMIFCYLSSIIHAQNQCLAFTKSLPKWKKQTIVINWFYYLIFTGPCSCIRYWQEARQLIFWKTLFSIGATQYIYKYRTIFKIRYIFELSKKTKVFNSITKTKKTAVINFITITKKTAVINFVTKTSKTDVSNSITNKIRKLWWLLL